VCEHRSDHDYWIGLITVLQTEWMDGNPSPYRNWATRKSYPLEKCFNYKDKEFYSKYCNAKYLYTCKKGQFLPICCKDALVTDQIPWTHEFLKSNQHVHVGWAQFNLYLRELMKRRSDMDGRGKGHERKRGAVGRRLCAGREGNEKVPLCQIPSLLRGGILRRVTRSYIVSLLGL